MNTLIIAKKSELHTMSDYFIYKNKNSCIMQFSGSLSDKTHKILTNKCHFRVLFNFTILKLIK